MTDAANRWGLTADVWLGEQLGVAAWRVTSGGSESLARLSATPAFAYAKVDVADVTAVRELIAHDFYPVDVAMLLEGPPPSGPDASDIRFANVGDRGACVEIARTAFQYSRFHLDPLIPERVANDIKGEWVGNYFTGRRGNALVVAEDRARITAFLQLLWQPPDTLIIDLIGVNRTDQRRGIARRLIQFAARHGCGDGRVPARIKVGTQAANAKSLQLYESLGLRVTGAHYVLHRHNC